MRVIDRGIKGISFLLMSMVFYIVFIVFEIIMVCGIFIYQFGWEFVVIMVCIMVMYIVFIIWIMVWRIKFRRQVNVVDNCVLMVVVDSLINYEVVKYFNNEKYEIGCYDWVLQQYEKSSIKVVIFLVFLNFG